MLITSGSFWSPPLPHWQASFFAVVLGVSLHVFYYMKGHNEPQKVQIAMAHLLLFPAVSVTVAMIGGPIRVSLASSVQVWISFHSGLAVSIVLYRVLFHPISRIPGPFWAKITKIPTMAIARRGKLHELHTEWARRYGPIVRIGQYLRTTSAS